LPGIPSRATITFTDRGSAPVAIRTGDTITVGGGPLADDVPIERDLEWVAEPDPSCTGEPFVADSVTLS